MKKIRNLLTFLCAITIANTTINFSNNKSTINEASTNQDGYYMYNAELPEVINDYPLVLTENYATHYFKNLTSNYGYNEFNSCGYIACAMLLSFWDTYWDDNVIEEKYEAHSVLPYDHASLTVESPGIKREPEYMYSGTGEQYHNYINNYYNSYFHFLLLKMGDQLYGTTPGSYFIKRTNYKKLLSYYLYDYRGYSKEEVEIIDTDEDVYRTAVSLIKEGIPVKLSVSGHAVIGYDYNKRKNDIYCHFGWGPETSHVLPEDLNHYVFEHLTAIRFKNVHSNNYDYSSNGSMKHHCSCENFIPYEINEENYYLDTLPTFSWNCLPNEKWFYDDDAYISFKLLNSRKKVIYDSNKLYENRITLGPDTVKKWLQEEQNGFCMIKISMSSYFNPELNDFYYYFRTVYKPVGYSNSSNKYISPVSISKSGSTWSVYIRNNSMLPIDVEYNSLLCNYNDAKNWKGLKNLQTVSIDPFGYTYIYVSKNWFADCVTMSHKIGNKRYVTFMNGLKENGQFASNVNIV